ncbi:MAG TPA: hypothetical protein VJN96_05185 [Vicinamibacterales bacterium]|nr:hypothetical protein [Vicinamibacterales bacterium]
MRATLALLFAAWIVGITVADQLCCSDGCTSEPLSNQTAHRTTPECAICVGLGPIASVPFVVFLGPSPVFRQLISRAPRAPFLQPIEHPPRTT